MASCLVILFDCLFLPFGGKGTYAIFLPAAMAQALGFSILVPISTGIISWFPLDDVRVRHRQFNCFIGFTLLDLAIIALNNYTWIQLGI